MERLCLHLMGEVPQDRYNFLFWSSGPNLVFVHLLHWFICNNQSANGQQKVVSMMSLLVIALAIMISEDTDADDALMDGRALASRQ